MDAGLYKMLNYKYSKTPVMARLCGQCSKRETSWFPISLAYIYIYIYISRDKKMVINIYPLNHLNLNAQHITKIVIWRPFFLNWHSRGPFQQYGLTLISKWMNNYTHYIVCDENNYRILNFTGPKFEVKEWMSNFIAHSTGHVIIYPC